MTRSICKIDGCNRFVTGRGLCNAHYRMERRHGDPLVRKGHTPGTVRAWMSDHASYTGKECLEFPFARSRQGYGNIGFDGFSLAHRWMCQEANGAPEKASMMALHSCGNGHLGCVNPNHLYWGSGKQNYQDQVKHGVAAIGERIGIAVLDEGKVREIRKLHKSGEIGCKRLGKKFSVDESTIRAVIKNKTWRNVSP